MSAGGRNLLASYIENPVADLKAALRGGAVGVDRHDRDTLAAGAVDIAGRGKRQAEARADVVRFASHEAYLCLALTRQLAKC